MITVIGILLFRIRLRMKMKCIHAHAAVENLPVMKWMQTILFRGAVGEAIQGKICSCCADTVTGRKKNSMDDTFTDLARREREIERQNAQDAVFLDSMRKRR